MYEQIAMVTLGALLSGLTTYIVGKKVVNGAKNDIINDLFDFVNSENGMKQIYQLGVIAGNGLRQGVGIEVGRGKFKWNDLLGAAATGIIQNMFPQLGQSAPGEQTQPLNPSKPNPYSKARE